MEENGGDEATLPLVQVLGTVLERLVETNMHHPSKALTKFSAAKRPAISIHDYLMRIHLYGRCSPSCFVLALVYIDRLIQRDGFVLVGLNVHRVIITSLMVAAKFFDDFYFNNAFYARVGGIGTVEINELEVDFLRRLEYSLHVTSEEFERYSQELRVHAENTLDLDRCEVFSVTSSTIVDQLQMEQEEQYRTYHLHQSQPKSSSNNKSSEAKKAKRVESAEEPYSPSMIDHRSQGNKQADQRSRQGGGHTITDSARAESKKEFKDTQIPSKDTQDIRPPQASNPLIDSRKSQSHSPTTSTSTTASTSTPASSAASTTSKRSSLRLSWPSAMSNWYAPIANVLPTRTVTQKT